MKLVSTFDEWTFHNVFVRPQFVDDGENRVVRYDQGGVNKHRLESVTVFDLGVQDGRVGSTERRRVRRSEEDWGQKINRWLISLETKRSSSEQEPVDLLKVDGTVDSVHKVRKVDVRLFKCLGEGESIRISHRPCIEDDVPVILVKEAAEEVENTDGFVEFEIVMRWLVPSCLIVCKGPQQTCYQFAPLSACKKATLECHVEYSRSKFLHSICPCVEEQRSCLG